MRGGVKRMPRKRPPPTSIIASSTFTTEANAGDSGRKLTRSFCPRCGSMLVIDPEGFPGMTLIMGGTFDDTSRLKLTIWL